MPASESSQPSSPYDLPLPGKADSDELVPAPPPRADLQKGLRGAQTQPSPDRSRRPVCLVIPAEASRGLPAELASNLEVSLPEVRAVTEGQFESTTALHPDAVWIMGCPASDFGSVASVRERFPRAFVLVTCRDLSAARATEFEEAGADRALTWAGTIAGVRRELNGALV